MRHFKIQWFDHTPDNTQPYMVALSPSVHHGAQGTKYYKSREALASDLRRLGLSDREIEAFFSDPMRHNMLPRHPLTDEDAAYLGWVH
jgi:hypothetical protein